MRVAELRRQTRELLASLDDINPRDPVALWLCLAVASGIIAGAAKLVEELEERRRGCPWCGGSSGSSGGDTP